MSNRIERVTVVGGGTAGWLAALLLTTFMNQRRDGPGITVELIESPNIPTVGVGEATVPGMPRLLAQLGIDEAEFFRRCNASFKCGVRFQGWSRHADGSARDFIHPFNAGFAINGGHVPAYHFHRYAVPGGATDMVDGLVPNAAMIANRRGPRRIQDGEYENSIGYSYHLDAALFANYLRDLGVERGVRHILDDVEEVQLNERGHVSALRLARGGEHEVEFVIDCTGFRGLILTGALDEPFEPWGKHLLCDRALALQVEHADPTTLDVSTGATALGAGWVWNVPLFSRVGAGYVFSSAFRSDDEARAEFTEHLTGLGYRIDGEPKAISMRVGRARRAWVGNCVAIGLSGGFIEPLEATAIYSIEMTIRHFIHNFPDRDVSPVLAGRFNRLVETLQDNILEFIVMHYALSNRDEPFWVAARSDIELPDALVENLALWKHVLPGPGDTAANTLFDYWSYIFCLDGKGFFDGVEFPTEGSLRLDDWDEYTRGLNGLKARLMADMPDHRALVAAIRDGGGATQLGTVPLPGAVTRPVITGLRG